MDPIIFACSGSADVGEITDRAARKLAREGVAKLHCTTAMGAHVESFVKFVQQAETVVTIDGCNMNCATKCLHEAGVKQARSVSLDALGFKKGETPVAEERIECVAEAVRHLLDTSSRR